MFSRLRVRRWGRVSPLPSGGPPLAAAVPGGIFVLGTATPARTIKVIKGGIAVFMAPPALSTLGKGGKSGRSSKPGVAPAVRAGDLKTLSKGRIKELGFDPEAVKAEFAGKAGGTYNLATDKSGNVFLVPVKKGTAPPVETGLSLEELRRIFPAGR